MVETFEVVKSRSRGKVTAREVVPHPTAPRVCRRGGCAERAVKQDPFATGDEAEFCRRHLETLAEQRQLAAEEKAKGKWGRTP
jgi:hypothetical protein